MCQNEIYPGPGQILGLAHIMGKLAGVRDSLAPLKRVVVVLVAQFCLSLFLSLPTRLLRPWDFPEYWSGLPFPPPGDLPDPGSEPASSTSPLWVDSLPLSHRESAEAS